MFTHVTEFFKGVDHALSRAFADARHVSDVNQVHGATCSPKAAQHGKPFFQRLVEKRVVVITHGASLALSNAISIDSRYL